MNVITINIAPCLRAAERLPAEASRYAKRGFSTTSTFDMSGGPKGAKRPLGRPLDGGVSEVIGLLPQIAPKKH